MNNTRMICIKKHLYNKGFSILETVVYLSMLAILTVSVMSSFISLFKTYSVVKSQQDIELSAIQILDKLTRDIRDTTGVITGTFNVPQGSISLSITNDSITDTYLYTNASGTVKVFKNGTYLGNLSQTGIYVNNFTLRQVVGSTVAADAIKIELDLQATPRYGTSTINKKFYTTVQQRN